MAALLTSTISSIETCEKIVTTKFIVTKYLKSFNEDSKKKCVGNSTSLFHISYTNNCQELRTNSIKIGANRNLHTKKKT